ncbi:MAG: cysteine hydrolase [Spirochaetia bacterium]|jgi:nicotinamidase-related amidase|nr:cysteine hydrolase [Spirochaetia bacterium]
MSKILFVVDMQNDFIDGVLGSPAAVAIIKPMAQFLATFQGTVYFTQDTHPKDCYGTTLEGKTLPLHCEPTSNGWQIASQLAPYVQKDHTIEKNTFGSLELPDYITKETDEVFFCGVCTDICVVSNALLLRATYPDLPITVYGDLCAGSSEARHQAALSVMASCMISIRQAGK